MNAPRTPRLRHSRPHAARHQGQSRSGCRVQRSCERSSSLFAAASPGCDQPQQTDEGKIDATNIEDIVAVDLSPETASEDRYWILQGSFEGETVASGFDGPQQRGHYGNFETFETESADSSALYGVNDGTVVVATDPNDYEQAIDGVRGEIPSLVEDYREFEKLARTLGDLDWVTVSIGETGENLPGNPVADGRGAEVRSGKSGYRVAAVYETEAVAREYETAFKREATRTRETIWDHKTAVDGRAIVLTASVPTAALGVSSTNQATGRQNILNRKEV